ncbi:MAG: hypothetical protein J7L96_03885 [Bacteroidales bacterium]|nr:hypothetical protein [Bacteroidales bacterium]
MVLVSLYTEKVLDLTLPYQIMAYLPMGIVTMWLVSLLTPREPSEKLRQFYTLLDTPVGQESRLRDEGVDIKLEGISVSRKQKAESISQKVRGEREKGKGRKQDAGIGDDGLILVDLLSLRSKFSWKRYRVDIIGFAVASLIVGFLLLMMIFLAQLGG